MKTYIEFSEQAYSSKAQIDEGLGTILRLAKKPVQRLAKGALNWFNKGKNTRIPNEAQARFGTPLEYLKKNPNPTTLFGDDALQRGMSDTAYAAGKKPSLLGRPDQAFNPFRPASKGGPGSGPTPVTRELIKRPIRAAKNRLGLDK
jgi:hypothetical protein